MVRVFLCFVFPVVAILSCTHAPKLTKEALHVSLYDQIYFEKQPQKIRGGGDVSLSLNGERYYGSVDMLWESSGNFRADFYSPFGGVIASVKADSIEGVMNIKENNYKFMINQPMDSLPFIWGKSLTFKKFILLLTGQLSAVSGNLKGKPDSIISKSRYSTAFWETDTFVISAEVNRRSSRIEKIQFQTPSWCMQFRSIKEKLAHFIEFNEDDSNYFSLQYEQLKLE